MGEINCTKCGIKSTIKDGKNPVFACDFCRRYYCGDCSNLNSSEVKCMPIQKRTLIFYCLECREGNLLKVYEMRITEEIRKAYETFGKELSKKLCVELEKFRKEMGKEYKKTQDELEKNREEIGKECEKTQNEIVHQLTNEIQLLKKHTSVDLTYSAAVQTKPNVSEVLVVKPKEKQDSSKTKTDIKQKIDPKQLAIGIENIKEARGGAVIINCSNKQTKEKIKEKVENEMVNYNVQEGLLKNPKIIIKGVEDELIKGSNELIIEAIKEQNDLHTDELVVIKKYQQVGNRNKGNIILGVKNVALKEKICNEGRLNIGWRRCFVQEFFSIIRCFKCARYGHMASKCENFETCFKCAGAHKTSDCVSTILKCINCSEANLKYKKSLKEDHMATDSECECYRRMVNIESKKTKTQ